MKGGQDILKMNILGVCGELYGLRTIDSPDIRNPMWNLIKSQKYKINLGDQKIGNFRFRQAESSPEHLGKQMAACRVRMPI